MYFEIQYWQETTSESETCSDKCYRDLFMSFEYIHYNFINIPVYGPSLVSAWHFRIVRKTNKIFVTFANLAKTRKHLSLLRLSQNRYSQLRRYTELSHPEYRHWRWCYSDILYEGLFKMIYGRGVTPLWAIKMWAWIWYAE